MLGSNCSLLVIDDERYVLDTLAYGLRQEFEVIPATSSEEALRILGQRDIDIILTDQNLPGRKGVELLEIVRQKYPRAIRLLMTGFAELEDAVEAINRGQVYRYLLKPWRFDELLQVLRDAAKAFLLERKNQKLLEELRRLNEELENRVQERTRELEEANRQLQQRNLVLERLALTDELTGLPNRRAMEQILHSEFLRRARYPNPIAIGLVDADHFKQINTRYLYPGGDEVLKALARTLNASIRGTDTVGRIGGEEFLVVAPVTDMDGASSLAERIRQAVAEMRVRYKEHEIGITASVGIAVADVDMQIEADQLQHQAAAALQEAKARGRNRSIVRMAECFNFEPAILPV